MLMTRGRFTCLPRILISFRQHSTLSSSFTPVNQKLNTMITQSRSHIEMLEMYITSKPVMNTVNIATLVSSMGKLGEITRDEKAKIALNDIYDLIVNEVHSFDSRGLTSIAVGASHIGVDAPKMFSSLASALVRDEILESLTPQGLANVIWAFSKQNNRDASDYQTLFDTFEPFIVKNIHEFNDQALSNIACGYATARRKSIPVFEAIQQESCLKAGDFGSQAVVNLLWAFSKAELRSCALFAAMTPILSRKVGSMKAQGISSVVWAFAKQSDLDSHAVSLCGGDAALSLRIANETLSQFVGVVVRQVDRFTAQALCNVTWGYATAGVADASPVFEAVASRLIDAEVCKELNGQGIANTLWAFAISSSRDSRPVTRKVFQGMQPIVLDTMSKFTPEALSSVLWSYAKADIASVEVFQGAMPRIEREASIFTSHSLSNIVLAYAKAGFDSTFVFIPAARELKLRGGELTVQAISNIAWSCAIAGLVDDGLYRVVVDSLLRKLPRSASKIRSRETAQGITTVLWSLMVADSPLLDNTLMTRLLRVVDVSTLDIQGKCQLYQCLIDFGIRFPGVPLKVDEPEAFLVACRHAFQQFSIGVDNSSKMHQHVFDLLKDNLMVTFEHVTPEGYSVDLLLGGEWKEGKRLCIEIDGPRHFYTGTCNPNATTLLKKRHLEHLGFHVIALSYFEWQDCKSEPERSELIYSKLFHYLPA